MNTKKYEHLFYRAEDTFEMSSAINQGITDQLFAVSYRTMVAWTKQLGYLHGLVAQKQQYRSLLNKYPDNEVLAGDYVALKERIKTAENIMIDKTCQINEIAVCNGLPLVLHWKILRNKKKAGRAFRAYAGDLVQTHDRVAC